MNDVPLGQSAWRYKAGEPGARRIGLIDAEHISTLSQEQISTVRTYNTQGDAIGWSRRYVNGVWAGQSAWFLSSQSNETVRIGLIDGPHVNPVGIPARHSEALMLAECGVVAGVSALYHSAPLPPGNSVWVFDPAVGVTRRTGLFDAEHVDVSGYHSSSVVRLTPDGTLIGTSDRFVNRQFAGSTLWYHPRGAPSATPLGLTDDEHTGASGTRSSSFFSITDTLIFGSSERWQGGWTSRGRTAWIYDRTTGAYTRVGLTDEEHTSVSGTRYSGASLLPDGRILGNSRRYSGDVHIGHTSWIWDPKSDTYQRIGFADATHTSPSSGYRQSVVHYILPTGFLIGSSRRWTPQERETSWAYDLATGETTVLGIADEEHVVDSSGLPDGYPILGGVGRAYGDFAAGRTKRPGGGDTPWFRDMRNGDTMPMGLWDSRHTNPNGRRDVWGGTADLIAGKTLGSAPRFIESGDGGLTPFIFDTADGSVTPLIFSERADGFAWSLAYSLAEDGTVIGSFLDHEAEDGISYRTFAWNSATGMRPLDEVIEGGFESAGYRVHQDSSSEVLVFARDAGTWAGIAYSIHRPGRLTYVLAPLPPCTADFDHDGEVASPDFFAFLTAWFILDPRTDMDADGAITSADLFAFLTAWFAGCD